MDKIARIRKAIVAAGAAFSGMVAQSATDGTITSAEWAAAAGVAVLTAALTWAVPNRPEPPA
jgi:hypothetical protein